jgi:hypothetical protein
MRASSHSSLLIAAEMIDRPSPRPTTPSLNFVVAVMFDSSHGKNPEDLDFGEIGHRSKRYVREL